MKCALVMPLTRDIMVTFDLGHFHPTESVADKISSTLVIWIKYCCIRAAGSLG